MNDTDKLLGWLKEREVEIERLRAAVKYREEQIKDLRGVRRCPKDTAEIARLRDAIEWIYTHPEDPKLVQQKAEEVRGE